MKKRVGMWKYLLSVILTLALCATNALAVNVEGTVSYSGTGRVYIKAQTNRGEFGTSISAPGSYIIRGLPTGNYTLNAFMDTLGVGDRVYSSPSGSVSTSSTSSDINATITAPAITLTNPTPLTPGKPTQVKAFPGDASVLIGWDHEKNSNGLEIADGYTIYWNTSPSVSSTNSLGSKQVTARMDSPAVIGGLANTTSYYFVVVPHAGGVNGIPSDVFGPITVGAPTGGNTVSGTVNQSGIKPTGPLYVAVVTQQSKGMGNVYYIKIPTLEITAAKSFSISGIPDGTYNVFAIYDMNDDGVFAFGDVTNSDLSAPVVNLSGSGASGIAINLIGQNADAAITTSHRKDTSNNSEWFNIDGRVRGQIKQPVKVALTAAPSNSGFLIPKDIPSQGNEFVFWDGNDSQVRPTVGDSYTFEVTYADGLVENIDRLVTGVLDSFPVNPAISGSPVTTTPTFTWQAPATNTNPPPVYSYGIWVYDRNNDHDTWNSPMMPSSQFSVPYGFGGDASLLQVNAPYEWNLSVRDVNGNEASLKNFFTPTVNTSPNPGTASGTYTYNSGSGVLSLNWLNSTFVCGGATVGTETATVTSLAATTMTWTWTDGSSMTWTRSGGTAGSILGSWAYTETSNGDSIIVTFNVDGTITATGATYCNSTTTPSTFTFTGRVQDCTSATATCTDLQGVTIATVGLSPELTTTSDVNGSFSLNVPVTSTLNSLPATAPFHFIMSSPSLVNSASSKIQLTANNNASDRPYSLFPATKLTAWGNSAGNGVIRSRVVDSANPATGYIAGAVVTATTSTSQQLPVEYVDLTGAISTATSTFANGMYIVKNIPAGAIVNVTASAPGYTNFQPRSFNIYADTVSQGRVAGTASSVITLTGGVQDCTTSTCTPLQGVTVTTVGLSPNLTATSDASGLFTFNIPATSTINSQPATVPFHLVFSKAGFNNSASSQMQFTSSMNISDRPYALFSSANVSSWGNSTGTGVIRSRIVDAANPVSGNISGATVTASTSAGSLVVEYVDPSGTIVSTGPTGANGMYIIKNIPAGAFVTVNASAPNYSSFQTKQFTVYADTVSQGRITGVASVTADTIPPSVPTNVTANAVSASQINVGWSTSTDNVGVASYKVYRDNNFVTQPVGTSWSDMTVAAMSTYSYSVAACDAANNCSAQSNPITVTTPSGGTTTGPVTVTGTISYSGTKTGRVYVTMQTQNGNLGTSVPWPAGTTSASYSIKGVPSQSLNNSISAFMDILENGSQSASSPVFGSATTPTSTTVRDIALSDPVLFTPAAPALVEVQPGPSSVFIMWDGNRVKGVADADYYDIYWGTSAQVSSTSFTGSKLGVPAGMDSPVVIDALTNGSSYYFQVVPRLAALPSLVAKTVGAVTTTIGTPSSVVGPITVGATTGLNTVVGTVTSTAPTGPLYVAVVGVSSNKGMGNLYYTVIPNPTTTNSFSISGIPNGIYNVYTIIDMNNDRMFGISDITNTNREEAPLVSLTGSGGSVGTIVLTSKNSDAVVNTDHRKYFGTTGALAEHYNVDGSVRGQLKRPVLVTLTGVPTSSTLTVPMDLGVRNDGDTEFSFWSGTTTRPVVDETYTFDITYADGTVETAVIAKVTGVSDSFPVSPALSSPVSTIPTFSWTAPTPAPVGNYFYSVWVGSNNNNNNTNMWDAWDIPSNQLSIIYGSGDSSPASLQIGSSYNWNISTRDQNGNRATIEGNSFTPTVAGTVTDTTPPVIISTTPGNNAVGVSITTPLSITFSEAITGMPDVATALKNNATGQYVTGVGIPSVDGKTHTFTPSSPLLPGTTYSIQLSTVTDMVGNPLPATTLTFTTAAAPVTDTTAPVIITTIPANNATGVSLTAQIAITFSEVIRGMPEPATAVKNNATGQYVVGVPSESTDGKTMIFTPSAPLSPSTTYSIQLLTVTDIAGNKLPSTTLTFTTAAGVTLSTIPTPPGGAYTSAQSVVLTSNVAGSTIYYTTNGDVPTTTSSVYTAPIAINSTTTLKFFSSNPAAATSEPVRSLLYSIDSTPPVTTASLASGAFTSAQSVTLTANEKATIFFTLNGATPTITSPVYTRPIVIASTATLKFFARDSAGNREVEQAILYTIDSTPPKVTPVPEGGVFASTQNVTLSTDETATIYYTIDGTEPTITSSVYVSAIPVSFTTTLKFFAKDTAGNVGVTHSAVYTIDATAPVLETTIPATTANAATGVSIGTKFSVTFSEAVTGLPEVTAVLKNETTGQYVAGTGISSLDNKIHTFIPSAQLTPGTTYSILFATVKDMAGNALPPTTLTFTTAAAASSDNVPPLSVASVETGQVFSSAQSIVLKANETAKIYYTTDGTTPTTSSTLYSAPIMISATTTLKFFAVDTAGNSEVDVNSVQYYVVPGGDINQDGEVGIADALKMLEIAVGRADATSANRKNADVAPLVNGIPNPDGKIDIGDVVVILRRIVGSVTW